MITSTRYINKIVNVKIDRPLNSKHPKHGFIYPVNYGFIPNTISGDGEELDAYVLGIEKPLKEFKGKCIAVIHRTNDNDDKLVVVPEEMNVSKVDIEKQTFFQEQWFKHIIITNPNVTKTHFGIYGVNIKNGKVLVIKKSRGPYTGLYDLPGGSPEKGETPEETLIREIKEETNLDVTHFNVRNKKSIIFSDFTEESKEIGVLQHEAILYDIETQGEILTIGDGLDSKGALWVNLEDLNSENSTPLLLISAGKDVISIADEKDNVIGTLIRGENLKKNRFVRISAILMFNSKGNLILQKISHRKKWGGLWSYSAAGHVDAGETYEEAAVRELKEEMGIDACLEYEIAKYPVLYNGRQVAFHHTFLVRSDAKIIPDIREVEEIKEFSIQELKDLIKQNPEQFFPPLLQALKFF